MIDLTPIFQAVIALLAALVTYKLIPWIKSRTTQQQQENLSAAAKIVVFAAEQIYGAGHGDDKLEYALAALRRAGFDLDTTLAREAIERAVREMQWNPLAALIDTDDQDTEADDQPAADAPADAPEAHPPEADDGSW